MVMNISCKFEKGSYNIFSLSVKISPKRSKMASVRYFGSLWNPQTCKQSNRSNRKVIDWSQLQ